MKKTRILALVLCALMLLAMFAGCAKTETTPDAGTTTPDAGTTTPSTGTTTPDAGTTTPDAGTAFQYTGSYPVVEEKTTLEWYCTNGGGLDYDWSTKEWLHTLCDMANIELDMTLIDNAVYKDTATPMLAAGVDLPEVWQMPQIDWDGTYTSSGMIKEITEYVDTYGYNLNKTFELNSSWKGSMTDTEGKIWYFPTMLNGTFQQIGLMMVRSYLDLLGWEQPDNIDDLYDYLCDIRDNDCNGDGDPTDEVPMFNRNGGRVTQMAGLWGCEMASRWTVNADDEKEIDFSYTMDKYLEFLTYYNRLYEEDLMNKDFDSAGLDQQNNLHAYNRVGMNTQYIGLTVDWTLDWDPDWDMDNDPLLHIPVAPLKGGCDKPFWVGRSEVNPTFAINSALEEDKAIAAFCFMDFMIGTEAQIIRNCGTDDEKFEIDYEAGLIHKYDKAFYSDNGSKLGSNFKGIPDNEKWYQVEGLMNYNGRDYTAHLAADAENGWTIVPTIVNCYKLPEEQEIIERYETDLTTYCDEHFSGFIAGNIELTEWDNYVATCESMGSLELDEVYTAVYHRLRGIEA